MQESQSNGKKKNNRKKKKDKSSSHGSNPNYVPGPSYGSSCNSDITTSTTMTIPLNRPKTQQNYPHGHSTQQTQHAARERAKADALFASTSSHWYAGAAFDRSPAANTLPRPTRLLNRTDEQFATSYPTSSMIEYVTTPAGSRTRGDSPPLRGGNDNEELREKSRELLRMLKSNGDPVETKSNGEPVKTKSTASPSSGEDLEEMTRQVRKLLNLS